MYTRLQQQMGPFNTSSTIMTTCVVALFGCHVMIAYIVKSGHTIKMRNSNNKVQKKNESKQVRKWKESTV